MKNLLLFLSLLSTALSTATSTVFAQDTIQVGTNLAIRTDEEIRVKANSGDGRVYTGVVGNDVADRDGRVVIPRGSSAELIARRVSGSEMSIDLEAVTVSGHRYAVFASDDTQANRDAVGANRRTGKYVGGGAVLGTLLGAVAGGGKGAAIGALAGAGAGAGTQMLTRGKNLNIPAETLLTFRLEQPLRVDVPDSGRDRDGHHYHDDRDRFQRPDRDR